MTNSELSEFLNKVLVYYRDIKTYEHPFIIFDKIENSDFKNYAIMNIIIDKLLKDKYLLNPPYDSYENEYCISGDGIIFINSGGYKITEIKSNEVYIKSFNDTSKDKDIISIIDTYFDDVEFVFEDGYDVLKEFLLNYIKNDEISSNKEIEFASIDRKKLGWKFNLVFKRFDKKITIDFLKFAKTKINRFKDMPLDETKYRNSNLYRSFTEKRL